MPEVTRASVVDPVTPPWWVLHLHCRGAHSLQASGRHGETLRDEAPQTPGPSQLWSPLE